MERNPIFITAGEGLMELFAICRHVMCPHYDTCLDEAVIKDLHFDCGHCAYKEKNIVSYSKYEGMAA